MDDGAAFSVLIISIVFGVAIGAGCHQMGVVQGLSTAIGVIAFIALGWFLCWSNTDAKSRK